MIYVLGLGQSVSIEEYGCTRVNECLLSAEFPVGHYAGGKVGINRQHSGTYVTYQDGCVMSGVAVVQTAGGQIQDSHKYGDEHV